MCSRNPSRAHPCSHTQHLVQGIYIAGPKYCGILPTCMCVLLKNIQGFNCCKSFKYIQHSMDSFHFAQNTKICNRKIQLTIPTVSFSNSSFSLWKLLLCKNRGILMISTCLSNATNYTNATLYMSCFICYSIWIVFLFSGGLSIIHQPTKYQTSCIKLRGVGWGGCVPCIRAFCLQPKFFMNPGPHMKGYLRKREAMQL